MTLPSQELASLIHTHHQPAVEDLPYWLAQAQRALGPALELGCGTGRVLLPLAHAGIPVIGVDTDPVALHLLRAESQPVCPPLVQADFTRLPLTGQFSFIYMPCNTYSTLSRAERNRLLPDLKRRLTPDGVFSASLPNPAALLALEDSEAEVEDTFIHPATGYPVQVSSEWQRRAATLTVLWHYDHLLPDGRVERHTATTCHNITPVADLLAELAAQGLVAVAYGDYDHQPYSAAAPLLLLEARSSSGILVQSIEA